MKLQKKTLPNGLRILSIPMKNVQTVMAMVLVGTGSEYESKRENGLAHFLEHMCFKGTTKRPTAHDITYELDCIGADYNAFTGGTYTGYYAKAHKKHTHKIVDIISDIYLNSTFPEKELKKEKSVIVEEINMREDNPRSKVGEVFDQLVFGDTAPGRPISGTKETVESFTREDLVRYHQKFYVPGSTIMIVAGAVPKDIEKTITELFKGMKKKKVTKKEKVVPDRKGPAVKVFHKDTNQTQIVMGFVTPITMFDKRSPAAKTVGVALGAGMSSRLFSKIREEMGLCYSISAGVSTGYDGGMLVVRAGVGNDKVTEAISAIMHELKKMRDDGLDEKELRKVKDFRLSGLVLGLETSEDFAEYYGFQELTGKKVRTPEESAERIEAVTLKQANAVAKHLLQEDGLYMALVGPHKDAQKFKAVLKLD